MTETRRQSDDRLRLTRLARGLSQGDLARTAGVTRQAISGIESGRWSPSLDVALSLARALGSTVEDLFGLAAEAPTVRSRLAVPSEGGAHAESGRLLVADVAGDSIAFPLTGDHSLLAGFVPALATGPFTPAASPATGKAPGSGRDRGTEIDARRIASRTPTLALAGCDPALALLMGPLQRHDPPVNLAWWSTSNAAAAGLLEAGLVHAAGLHRGVEARSRHRAGIEVVGFASWREGLTIVPGLRGRVRDVGDVARHGIRLANRERGAEARRLLDLELGRLGIDPGALPGYSSEVTGHLLAASAIASGLAEAAVVCEPAALAYGLDFVPWTEELSELHIPRSLLGSVEVKALLDVLAGRELPAQLTALEGYDAEPCGRIIAA